MLAHQIPDLGMEMVFFDVVETNVLTFAFGPPNIIKGNVPHRCVPVEIPKAPEPRHPPMVRCVACGEQVSPKAASLCITNWICHKCRPV